MGNIPSRSRFKIAVVIATKDRSVELANRALRSVVEQTRHPDYLVVVDDSARQFRSDNRRIVAAVDLLNTRVLYGENVRTAGAGGAWNTALDILHRETEDPAETFVAILDDDDRWGPHYLEHCENLAASKTLDMVAADIERIETIGSPPLPNSAPDQLRSEDCLVGNPGIQGSNLFVRLSILLAAGLFDERLRSTTDRDICIRIADLGGIRYHRLAESLVQHFADSGRPRLTTPRSEAKLQGLTAFWSKYRCRMTDSQRHEFKQRSLRIFGWEEKPTPLNLRLKASTVPEKTRPGKAIALVVGIIADVAHPERMAGLIEDLVHLHEDSRIAGLDVVLLENGVNSGDSASLDEASTRLLDSGAGCYVIPEERQRIDARAGLFGQSFVRSSGLVSIAVARTMLQTYAYIVARPRTGAVVWILDGDNRLDSLVWNGDNTVERQPCDVLGMLTRLRDEKVDIAIGAVTDAPPLPFASCVRTQLVDAYHNFETIAAHEPDAQWPDRQAENMDNRARCSDYYYDLSRRDTDHLETPFWYVPGKPGCSVRETFLEMVSRLPRMFAGEQVFRPLIIDGGKDPLSMRQPSVHRGGNTFIFDMDALRDFPNAALKINGSETRRSDMFWCLLNRHVAHRTVVKLPIAVRQDRHDEPVAAMDLGKLALDIQGYALYSALEDVLLEQLEADKWRNGTAHPGLDEVDAGRLEERMQKYLRERFAAFDLSFQRAAGLSRLLGRYTGDVGAQGWWWLQDPACTDAVRDLRSFVAQLQDRYDLKRLDGFRNKVFAIGIKEVHRFIDQLRADMDARGKAQKVMLEAERWIKSQRVRLAEYKVSKEYGATHLNLLGVGAEAVVLTDGCSVYKCLDYWKTRMPQEQLEFLRGQVGCWERAPGLYSLREVRSSGSWVVIRYDFEPSASYHGGHGEGLIRLLQSCRNVGIVCNNIHPDNLVVTEEGVKLIDYGSDIRPYSDEGFMHMARRAFLTCRHAERDDLKLLMHRALREPDMQELVGFERFLEAMEPTSKEQILDTHIVAKLGKGRARTLLDYGCGKGKLGVRLTDAGWKVTGFDPNPGLRKRWSSLNSGMRLGGKRFLDTLRSSNTTFDTVVCCLVLCLLEGEELQEVATDLRTFTASEGRLVVAVCNPRYVRGTTQLQRRFPPHGVGKDDVFNLEKIVFSTGARVVDVHRPVQQYIDLFDESGFEVDSVEETTGVDIETLEPTSDFMIFWLRRHSGKEGPQHDCS